MASSPQMTNETRPICMDCSWGATESGIAVLLCPRHAQAGEMETLLRDLRPMLEAASRHLGGHTGAPGDAVTGIEIEQRANASDNLRYFIAERLDPILSSIDQEKA